MKKIIAIAVICMISYTSVIAQKGQAINIFSLGAKVGYGLSMLQGDKADVTLKSIPNTLYYGPKFGFNPIEEIGVVGEYLMFSGKYSVESKITDSLSIKNDVTVKGTQIPILVRLSVKRVVAEAGISLNTIKTTENSLLLENRVFNKSHMDLIVGVGQSVAKAPMFAATIYARANYSLKPWSNDNYPFIYKTADVSNLMISFGVDFHWKVGYFATSRCGRKTGFLWY